MVAVNQYLFPFPKLIDEFESGRNHRLHELMLLLLVHIDYVQIQIVSIFQNEVIRVAL